MAKFFAWVLIIIGIVVVFIASTTLIISDKNQLVKICPNYKNGECSQKIDAVVAILREHAKRSKFLKPFKHEN